MENSIPPVSMGDRLDIECISIGKKGDGIFKHKGFIIIVPDTEVGETYSICIDKVLPNIAFGKIE